MNFYHFPTEFYFILCYAYVNLFPSVSTAPVGVKAPNWFQVYSGYIVETRWDPPASTAGLLTRYVLRAYNESHPDEPSVETLIVNITRRIGELRPSSVLKAVRLLS